MPKTKQIVARYSALKVGGWIALVVSFSVWVLIEGTSLGWRIPEWRYGWLFPVAVVASILGLITSAALILNFVFTQGAAIVKIDDEFVLYFPLSHKRVTSAGTTISATQHEAEVPAYGSTSLFKVPPVIAQQVTIRRSGQPDLNFRTGLLRESANVIAERMSSLAK